MINDRFIGELTKEVDRISTCPEQEIGLGVPRDPVRIVEKSGEIKLIQLHTMKDFTEKMSEFVSGYLDDMEKIDGVILKDRSPSCGIHNVKIYPNADKSSPIRKGAGFFGREILSRFPHLAVETDGRLKNYVLREHFLRKLFTFFRFRKMSESLSMKLLVEFQAKNKLLLLSQSEESLRLMGRVVANAEKKDIREVLELYRQHLAAAFAKPAGLGANINVLMHALGYFSKSLSSSEKKYFLNILEEYRRGQSPLSVPVGVLYGHIVRFGEEYLKDQTYFKAYPSELVSIKDSGQGRSQF